MKTKNIDKFLVLFLIIVLFSMFLFFCFLGQRSLWDPDEPRYAEAARVMLETKDYLTPRFNGSVRFDKPPLFYWLITIAYRLFGINEFSARFFSAFFAFLGAVLVFMIAKMTLDTRTAFISALILATSGEYLVLANAASTDMTFTFFIGLCLFFFFLGYKRLKGGMLWFLLSFASMALATLTKGPAGGILPLLVIGIFLILAKQFKLIFSPGFILGLILFILISLPWYFLAAKMHGKEYTDTFFLYHNISRFFSKDFHHQKPIYYFVYILPLGFLPWSLFLINALRSLLKSKAAALFENKKEWLFIFLWFLVPFLFFSISRAKLATYILPCFLPLALIVGRFLRERIFEKYIAYFVFMILFIFVIGALPIEKIVPKLSVKRTTKDISLEVGKLIKPQEQLGSCGIFKPSMVFYSHHNVELLSDNKAHKFFETVERVFCIFKKDTYEKVKNKIKAPVYVIAENERLVAVSNQQ